MDFRVPQSNTTTMGEPWEEHPIIIIALLLLGFIALYCTVEMLIVITTRTCNHAKDRNTNRNHNKPLIT